MIETLHIVVAMKPVEGNFASNAIEHGVAGLNVDGCRIETDGRPLREVADFRDDVEYHPTSLSGRVDGTLKSSKAVGTTTLGRFPANVIHDGSEEVLAEFPDCHGGTWNRTRGARHFNNNGEPTNFETSGSDNSVGSAARFFESCEQDGEDE